jgi:hypothetical protein
MNSPETPSFFRQFSRGAASQVALRRGEARLGNRRLMIKNAPPGSPRNKATEGTGPTTANSEKKDGGLGEFFPPALPVFS